MDIGVRIKLQEELETNDVGNILPLSPSAHRMWDDHHFALRPIKDKQSPDTIIYLQFDFELALNPQTGKRMKSPLWNRAPLAHSYGVEGSECELHALRHGDVLKFETSDPINCPLPSFSLLQLQYALHRLVASFNAGGGLHNLFRGPPPSGHAVSQYEACASEDEEELLRLAVLVDIITEEEADLWRAGFLRYTQEKAELEERDRKAFLDEFYSRLPRERWPRERDEQYCSD
jgi:hypothetical protein